MAVLAVGPAVGACGQPAAQRIEPPDSQFSYELPAHYVDLGLFEDVPSAAIYAPDGVAPEEMPRHPHVLVRVVPGSDHLSYQNLRMLATDNQFDPLDETLNPLPNGIQLVNYLEFAEPDWWGVRVLLVVGSNTFDHQILVDRHTNQVGISIVTCLRTCFAEEIDVINRIQTSWTLEAPDD